MNTMNNNPYKPKRWPQPPILDDLQRLIEFYGGYADFTVPEGVTGFTHIAMDPDDIDEYREITDKLVEWMRRSYLITKSLDGLMWDTNCIITGGMFAGEPWWVPYYHQLGLEGRWDSRIPRENCVEFRFKITHSDWLFFPELVDKLVIEITEHYKGGELKYVYGKAYPED